MHLQILNERHYMDYLESLTYVCFFQLRTQERSLLTGEFAARPTIGRSA